MRPWIQTIAFLFTLAFSAPLFAGTVPNLVGQFAFDWLQPTKTKCTAITAPVQATFKSCETFDAKSTQSFAGKGDFYKCAAGANHEYMIYKTKARCAEEFEIMESNGP